MTSGTVIIMGDPGPYAFSGMIGGTVYQKLTPEFCFDEKALARLTPTKPKKIQSGRV
jgi:glutamate synthase (NADPH) large chain